MTDLKITLKSDIEDLQPLFRSKKIGTRIIHSLQSCSCYCTVADLVSCSRDEIVWKCDGIGQSCLEEIERVLGENGLSLDTEVKDKEWAFVRNFAANLVGKCIRSVIGEFVEYMRVESARYSLARKCVTLSGRGLRMEFSHKGRLKCVYVMDEADYYYDRRPKELVRFVKVTDDSQFVRGYSDWKGVMDFAGKEKLRN